MALELINYETTYEDAPWPTRVPRAKTSVTWKFPAVTFNYGKRKAKHSPFITLSKSKSRGRQLFYHNFISPLPYKVGKKKYLNTYGQESNGKWYTYQSFNGQPYWDDPGIQTRVQALAANSMLRNLSSMNEGNLGVTIGELGETMGMIAHTATRVAGMFKALKKGNVGHVIDELFGNTANIPCKTWGNLRRQEVIKRHGRYRKRTSGLNSAANTWLELELGWKPLLQDVEAIAKATAIAQHEPLPQLIRANGFSTLVTGAKPQGGLARASGFKRVSVSRLCYLEFTDVDTRTANNFGLLNLASVAWELVPYSFVVDWFLPVGNYIESLSATAGMTYITGCESTRTVEKFKGVTQWTDKTPCSLTYSGDYFERRVVPLPSYDLPVESFQSEIDSWKVGTALALLQSAFGGGSYHPRK